MKRIESNKDFCLLRRDDYVYLNKWTKIIEVTLDIWDSPKIILADIVQTKYLYNSYSIRDLKLFPLYIPESEEEKAIAILSCNA